MMRLAANWLTHRGTTAVFDALDGHGAWFVGGCVRDGLLDRAVVDIDICTDAHPETVMERAGAAGLKTVPTGLQHGTVTVVAHGMGFEVTTLRRDLETDGRHATVAFTADMAQDAARRDFTMNALYATRDGTVLDPNGSGLDDLRAGRVRFIGDASARIAEDYLRILRFFRFHAWYADPDGGIDAEALAACAVGAAVGAGGGAGGAGGAGGLVQVSRERVGAEIIRLLRAPDPAPAVAAMDHAGVLAAVLPGASSRPLPLLLAMEGDRPPDAIRRLAAIGGEDVADRLRLSRAETGQLALYRAEMAAATTPGALGYRHGADAALDIVILRAMLFEQPPVALDIAAAQAGARAVFPIKAADLMPGLSGPALGARLSALESAWIDSGFALSKADLLSL